MKIGFALGGGGARGLVHVGVLKVLEAAGIQPSLIVGTSMGSLIGALYCHLQDANQLEKQILTQLHSPKLADLGMGRLSRQESRKFLRRNLNKTLENLTRVYLLTSVLTRDHIIAAEKIKSLLTLLLPPVAIEDLAIPFAAVATDLLSGPPYVFDQGPVITAVQASAAIPGIFPPVPLGKKQLVDGAITSLVPVAETRDLDADCVIAVDVSPFKTVHQPYKTGIEIWLRADQITGKTLRDVHLVNADVTISVSDLDFEWHAFHEAKNIIAAGVAAAEQALPAVRAALRARRPWWQRWWP